MLEQALGVYVRTEIYIYLFSRRRPDVVWSPVPHQGRRVGSTVIQSSLQSLSENHFHCCSARADLCRTLHVSCRALGVTLNFILQVALPLDRTRPLGVYINSD